MFALAGSAFIALALGAYKQLPGYGFWVNNDRRIGDVWLIMLALLTMESEGYQKIFRRTSAGMHFVILLLLLIKDARWKKKPVALIP